MPKMNLQDAMAVYEAEMAEKTFLASDERKLNAEEIRAEFEKMEEEDAAWMAELTRRSEEYWYIQGLKAEWEAEAERMDAEEDRLAIEAFFASEEAEEPVLEEVHSKRNGAYRRKQDRRAKRKLKEKAECAQRSYVKRAKRDMMGVVCIHGQKVWAKSWQTDMADELWKKANKQKLVEAIPA